MLRLDVVAGLLALAQVVPFPPPVALEADQIFHEAFITLMQKESAEWQLQPVPRRGPAPGGRPADATEELRWLRSDGASASVRYARYSSSEAAAAALAWKRAVISIGTSAVKLGVPPGSIADEAYTTDRSMWFRRGVFVFEVRLREPVKPNASEQPAIGLLVLKESPLARLSALFLSAADRVLTETGR